MLRFQCVVGILCIDIIISSISRRYGSIWSTWIFKCGSWSNEGNGHWKNAWFWLITEGV